MPDESFGYDVRGRGANMVNRYPIAAGQRVPRGVMQQPVAQPMMGRGPMAPAGVPPRGYRVPPEPRGPSFLTPSPFRVDPTQMPVMMPSPAAPSAAPMGMPFMSPGAGFLADPGYRRQPGGFPGTDQIVRRLLGL